MGEERVNDWLRTPKPHRCGGDPVDEGGVKIGHHHGRRQIDNESPEIPIRVARAVRELAIGEHVAEACMLLYSVDGMCTWCMEQGDISEPPLSAMEYVQHRVLPVFAGWV